jgi:DNA-directed RNA polymerase specialized sigma24 family protein
MLAKKIDRNLYRYAAEAIKAYPDDCERLNILNEYLAAPVGPDLGVSVDETNSLAQQDAVIERKYRSAEYRRLELRVRILNYIIDSLPNQDMALVEMRYFHNEPWSEVAKALNVSEETAKKRRAPKIIVRTAKMLFGDLC